MGRGIALAQGDQQTRDAIPLKSKSGAGGGEYPNNNKDEKGGGKRKKLKP